MPTIPKPDYIGFLIGRKYPETIEPPHPMAKALASNGIIYDDEEEWKPPSEATVKKAAQYREKLKKLSKPEIKSLYKNELSKKHHEDDERRFFNQQDAEADFDYWAKIPGWKVDEAVALTLGKNPKIVNKERLEKLYASPFAENYDKIREMVSRSRSAGLFTDNPIVMATDHIIPHKYVQWAQNADIGFPQKLAEKVLSFYEANKPPKTQLEKAMERLERSAHQNPIDIGKEQLEKLHTPVKGPLVQRAEKLLENKKMQDVEKPKPKSAHTKEQETLLKLLLGLALTNYTYNPLANRNFTAKEIADDLLLHGLSVDEDTVRKWLNRAKDCLPDDWKPNE